MTNTGNVCVFSFIAGFIALAYLGLKRSDVLSHSAIRNTLATLVMIINNIAMAPIIFLFAKLCHEIYDKLNLPHVHTNFLEWRTLADLGHPRRGLEGFLRLLEPPRHAHQVGLANPRCASFRFPVNGFTIFRVHALELMLMNAFYVLFLTSLGLPELLIATAYVVGSLHLAYVHFELDIDHGPFNWLIASPRFHRWHHADNPAAFGKNLANHLPLLDMAFGTYYNPGPCREKMGALNDGIPDHNGLKLTLLPFVLWRERISLTLTRIYLKLFQVRTQQ